MQLYSSFNSLRNNTSAGAIRLPSTVLVLIHYGILIRPHRRRPFGSVNPVCHVLLPFTLPIVSNLNTYPFIGCERERVNKHHHTLSCMAINIRIKGFAKERAMFARRASKNKTKPFQRDLYLAAISIVFILLGMCPRRWQPFGSADPVFTLFTLRLDFLPSLATVNGVIQYYSNHQQHVLTGLASGCTMAHHNRDRSGRASPHIIVYDDGVVSRCRTTHHDA